MTGFFTWIRDQRVRLSERFRAPEQEPAQQPGDDPDTADVEVSPSALPGPPPLTGRPPTWRDLIRDVLYVSEAQINFRKASLWLMGLLLLATVLAWAIAMALAALTPAVAPNAVPSMFHLVGSIAGLSGLTGGVWLWQWLRIRARRQESLPTAPPTDPAPTDPATGTGQQDPGPQG
ncbi:hypothetical protein [Streptomyces sp. NBC_00658]|uniref:hypothetical protein n=1 Tax=Streptomyces sp. NBC_00658 TaxID=2975800 RepID=UPI00324B0037